MPRIAVVGATGAVGGVLRGILRERGYDDVRLFASARSAGSMLDGRPVEEATPGALASLDADFAFFAVGTSASRELVPHAVSSGAVCLDKSAAWRMEPNVPLVVPEVNGQRAFEHEGIIAVPNCCTIPLPCVLKPLQNAAGLARIRVATYQSVSGAGAGRMERLRAEAPDDHDLAMDWDFDGEEFDEETKIRDEARKILELPDLPVSATCVRVPSWSVTPNRSGSRPSGRSTPRRRARCSPPRRASGSRRSPRRASPPASTRCSSGASATIAPAPASRSIWPRTTCGRARR